MPNLRRETGVALPVTLLVVVVLTITLAASFARVDADRAVSAGTGDAVTALAVAESGLQAYVASRASRPPEGDSVRFNLPGGYANVVAHVLTRNADTTVPQLFIVRSTGYVVVPEHGAVHQAVRTVAQFAQWQVPVIRQFAAFTAANDLDDRNPYAHTIDGTDLCGDSLPVWAVRTQRGSDMNQGTYVPDPPGAIESGSAQSVADTTAVDWSMVVSGTFVPDYTALVTGETSYKSQVIQGDVTLADASGTGLLAVTGNLRTSGNFAGWEGIVLVGGEIFFDADSTAFLGMVISGLREQLSGTGAPNARIGEEPVYIRYDSCRVRQTLAGLAGFAPIGNAWVDNWASY